MGDREELMLERVTYDEALSKWEKYRQHFKEAGSSSHSWAYDNDYFHKYFEQVFSRVLGEIQNHKMQLWSYWGEDSKEKYLTITRLNTDGFTGQKNLGVFSLVRIADVDHEVRDDFWNQLFFQTKRFADINGCIGIIANTVLPYVVERAEKHFQGVKVYDSLFLRLI